MTDVEKEREAFLIKIGQVEPTVAAPVEIVAEAPAPKSTAKKDEE